MLKEIIRSARMSARPEFYSGRGAILCDLNGNQLEIIYKGIKKTFGKEAGKQYLQMIKDIPKMSATDFLIALYKLERNKWRWDKSFVKNEQGSGVAFDNEITAMCSIFGAMSGLDDCDETHEIRDGFLMKHGIKPESKIFRGFNGEIIYYNS